MRKRNVNQLQKNSILSRLNATEREYIYKITPFLNMSGPFKLCDPLPNRVYLAFQWDAASSQIKIGSTPDEGEMISNSLDLTVNWFEFKIDKQIKLVTCRWDAIVAGPLTSINVHEVIYRG